MLDHVALRAYLNSVPENELDKTYEFLDLSGDPIEIKPKKFDLVQQYCDSGEGFNSIGFWRNLLAKEREVPRHMVKLARMELESEKITSSILDTSGKGDLSDTTSSDKQNLTLGTSNSSNPASTNGTTNMTTGNSSTSSTANAGNNNEAITKNATNAAGAPPGDENTGVENIANYTIDHPTPSGSPPDSDSESEEEIWDVEFGNHDDDDVRLLNFENYTHRFLVDFTQLLIEKQKTDLKRIKWYRLNSLGPERCSEFFFLELWREHLDFVHKMKFGYNLLISEKTQILGLKNIEKSLGLYPSKTDPQLFEVFLNKYPFREGCFNKAEFYRLCSENPDLALAMVNHPKLSIPPAKLNVVDPTNATLFNHKVPATMSLALLLVEKYEQKFSLAMLNAVTEPTFTTCLTQTVLEGYEEVALKLLSMDIWCGGEEDPNKRKEFTLSAVDSEEKVEAYFNAELRKYVFEKRKEQRESANEGHGSITKKAKSNSIIKPSSPSSKSPQQPKSAAYEDTLGMDVSWFTPVTFADLRLYYPEDFQTIPKLSLTLLTTASTKKYAILHRQHGREFSQLQEFFKYQGRHPTALDMALTLRMNNVADKMASRITEWQLLLEKGMEVMNLLKAEQE